MGTWLNQHLLALYMGVSDTNARHFLALAQKVMPVGDGGVQPQTQGSPGVTGHTDTWTVFGIGL